MPIELGQDVCPAEDDNGVKCRVLVTHEEQKQDGMCQRCADLIWHSLHDHNKPFVLHDPDTRSYQ